MTLNYLDPDRLILVPEKQHAEHEFCFFLHDTMVSLLQEAEKRRVSFVEYTFKDQAETEAFKKRDDPIAFFIENGRRDLASRITLNQVSLALYADLLHFLHDGLRALEKRKFAVAFTLLRKPLKQNLMFATWMCADERDFFTQMERSPAEYMEEKDLPKDRRIELLKKSIEKVENPSLLNAELLNGIIFDKDSERSLAPLFDKAAHLVTSRGRLMKTEELNLNFIFKNPADNDVYETIYLGLSYVLIYLVVLQIALYSRMGTIGQNFSNWFLLTSLGAYQSLFVEGPASLVRTLNKEMLDLLICPHCRRSISIRKADAARFFVSEMLRCGGCGMDHHFPFYWLMSKLKWSISQTSALSAVL